MKPGISGWSFGPAESKLGREDVAPGGDLLVRGHVLQVGADPVEGVPQAMILDVEAVAAHHPPVGEQDALGVGRVDRDADRDRVGKPPTIETPATSGTSAMFGK